MNVSWRAAEDISIRKLATVAGLSSARVHQLLAAVDLEARRRGGLGCRETLGRYRREATSVAIVFSVCS